MLLPFITAADDSLRCALLLLHDAIIDGAQRAIRVNTPRAAIVT